MCFKQRCEQVLDAQDSHSLNRSVEYVQKTFGLASLQVKICCVSMSESWELHTSTYVSRLRRHSDKQIVTCSEDLGHLQILTGLVHSCECDYAQVSFLWPRSLKNTSVRDFDSFIRRSRIRTDEMKMSLWDWVFSNTIDQRRIRKIPWTPLTAPSWGRDWLVPGKTWTSCHTSQHHDPKAYLAAICTTQGNIDELGVLQLYAIVCATWGSLL